MLRYTLGLVFFISIVMTQVQETGALFFVRGPYTVLVERHLPLNWTSLATQFPEKSITEFTTSG